MNRPVIVEALSYIRKFAGKRAVIKYGGAAMIDPALKRSFAEEMVLLQSAGLRPVIVHGGGPEITKTLEKMGRKSEFADGQRITGAEEVRVVEMVLTGRINTEIVGLINSLGGNAIGLSGKDGRLLIASKLETAPGKTDLGFVGEIDAVNADLLDMFLERGYMPVISPVGFGLDGASYNINADVAAGGDRLGLRRRAAHLPHRRGRHPRRQGNLLSEIKAADLEARLGKSIKGGMHVKARAVLDALAGGVRAVHIVDGRAPHSVVAELFTDRGVGTLVDLSSCLRQTVAARRHPRDPERAAGRQPGGAPAAARRAGHPRLAGDAVARHGDARRAARGRPRRARAISSTATAARCRSSPVRRLVDGVESNGALVIVRTKASAAATVARALDEAGLAEVHGDAGRRRHRVRRPPPRGGGHRVAGKLRVLLGLGWALSQAAFARGSRGNSRYIGPRHAERDRRPRAGRSGEAAVRDRPRADAGGRAGAHPPDRDRPQLRRCLLPDRALQGAQPAVHAGAGGAGVVEAVGPGVTEVAVGDRVAYAGVNGAYAETRVIAGRSAGATAAGDRRPDGRGHDVEGDDRRVSAPALRARRARRHHPVSRGGGRRRQHRLPVGEGARPARHRNGRRPRQGRARAPERLRRGDRHQERGLRRPASRS